MKIKRKTHRMQVSVMAMGDIAFNLLIFFVILARAQDDSHLKWQPADSLRIESAGHAKVSVLIDVDDKLYVDGQPLGISQLPGRIRDALGDAPRGDRVVLLKVHRETTALRFEPVIEAISEAGGDLVHILERKRE